MRVIERRHDTQHDDIQHNDIQHNEIHYNEIQHNNMKNVLLSIMTFNCYAKCRYAEFCLCLMSPLSPLC
jgi:hypothetical protein